MFVFNSRNQCQNLKADNRFWCHRKGVICPFFLILKKGLDQLDRWSHRP